MPVTPAHPNQGGGGSRGGMALAARMRGGRRGRCLRTGAGSALLARGRPCSRRPGSRRGSTQATSGSSMAGQARRRAAPSALGRLCRWGNGEQRTWLRQALQVGRHPPPVSLHVGTGSAGAAASSNNDCSGGAGRSSLGEVARWPGGTVARYPVRSRLACYSDRYRKG